MNLYIETLGCPKNITDSECAAGILEEAGHRIVSTPEEAQAILVNTCGFIGDAKEESIDRILSLAEHKESGAYLIVSGCLSERYRDKLAALIPEVDLFLGVNDYASLPQLLTDYIQDTQKTRFSDWEKTYRENRQRKNLGPSYFSYLKIAEGCDNVCAYCVIPSIRGGYRSRQLEEILKEASHLAASGTRELVLVAQDVTAYGIDLYGEYRLPELLEKLCEIENLHWIRLLYCYEDRITDELIRVIKEQDKICKYIDIPIQHSSDRVLAAMNRRSTAMSIRSTISRLREAIPDIHIRTTLITGFPGEKRQDFNELYDFVKEMKFHRLGVFHYSKEEGTPAAKMKGQVNKNTKLKRKEQIMNLQREISLSHNRDKIGTVLEVITEGREPDGSYYGRSRYDAPEIDNSVLFTSGKKREPGEFVRVIITDAFDYDLVGRCLE